MNAILPSWSDFDTLKCQLEGRNPDTGRVENVPRYRSDNQDTVDFKAKEAARQAKRRKKRIFVGLSDHEPEKEGWIDV